METLTKRVGHWLLVLGLALAPVACGDDKTKDGDDVPDLGGDGDKTGDGDATGDGDKTGDGDGTGDGDKTGDGDGDGTGDGDAPINPKDCFENPKTSLELLNQCLPEGSKVDSRKFNNKARIPNFTGTLPPVSG